MTMKANVNRRISGKAETAAGEAISLMLSEYRKDGNDPAPDKRPKKVYVALGYPDDTDESLKAAARCCRMVINAGCIPISARLMYRDVLHLDWPGDKARERQLKSALLNVCDEVWMFNCRIPYVYWEAEEAKRLNKTVRYCRVPEK